MPSTNLVDAHQLLQTAWPQIQLAYELAYPDHKVILTCTHRSVEEQQVLFAKGRIRNSDGTWSVINRKIIVTGCDGIHTLSNHNYYPSRALDFAVVISGKINWNFNEYEIVGELGEQHGLIWGGRWKPPTVVDGPHLEIKKEIA